MTVPAEAAGRLSSGLKRFVPILSAARARNANEPATSRIVTHMLADLFGYDMYGEETHRDDGYQMLIEVKAIGNEIEESHVGLAVDYAANRGIDWVALTNGPCWRVFRVNFSKPVHADLVLDLDLLSVNPKSKKDLDRLYLLTRESMLQSELYAYHAHLQATNALPLPASRTPRPRSQDRPRRAP